MWSYRIKRRSAFAAHLRKHGWNTEDLEIDTYSARKRVSRPKGSSISTKSTSVKAEPVFFTPTPLPTHHGVASQGQFLRYVSLSMPIYNSYPTLGPYPRNISYANHPHPSYHTATFNNSIYTNPLPNNTYSQEPSRTNTPGLTSCSSSSSSSVSPPSLCPTPEHLSHSRLTLPYDNPDNSADKMFMASFDPNSWSLGGAENMYHEAYSYLPHDGMPNGYRV